MEELAVCFPEDGEGLSGRCGELPLPTAGYSSESTAQMVPRASSAFFLLCCVVLCADFNWTWPHFLRTWWNIQVVSSVSGLSYTLHCTAYFFMVRNKT